MAFIDDLGLIEALLLLGGVLLTYVGLVGWYRMYKNDAKGLRQALTGASVPLGGVGLAATILGLWGEMVWNYQPWAFLGGYNIFFTDVVLLFGLVLVALSVSMYKELSLQYVGLFALVAGGITLFYGWTGYGYSYTKEPFETLLLYAGFGVSGIMASPATVLVDHYLANGATSKMFWTTAAPSRSARGLTGAVRAAQSISPSTTEEKNGDLRYRLPIYVSFLLLAFPVFMALAALAAYFYLGSTIPGHLTPGKTP